jgi:hydrogenase-4 membrane subunit HyfE
MTGLLIAYLIVLVVPLFVGTWRSSLLALSCQGVLLSWIAFRNGVHLSAAGVVEIIDLVGLRTLAAPWLLHGVLQRQNAPRRNDDVAPNMLSWTIALALVLMAFRVAGVLVPAEGDAQMLVAVSTSAALLGLLVLSTRSGPFSQMIGALRLENAIALFELGGERTSSLGVQVGQVAVFATSIVFFRWYLLHLTPEESTPTSPEKAVS